MSAYNLLFHNQEPPPFALDTRNLLDGHRAANIRQEALDSLPENLQLDETQLAARDTILPHRQKGILPHLWFAIPMSGGVVRQSVNMTGDKHASV